MPANLTITATDFYEFTANTKARAGEVNTNFTTVGRGHILPFRTDTVAAADNTYQVGSTEYRWQAGYFVNAYGTYFDATRMNSSTVTTSTIVCNSIQVSDIFINGANTASSWVIRNTGTYASGGCDFVSQQDGLIKASFRQPNDFYKINGSNPGIGGVGLSSYIDNSSIQSAALLSTSTITVQATGKPIIMQLITDASTATASYIGLDAAQMSGTSDVVSVTFYLMRNSTTLTGGQTLYLYPNLDNAGALSRKDAEMRWPVGSIMFVDYAATTGAMSYSLSVAPSKAGGLFSWGFHIRNARFVGKEQII